MHPPRCYTKANDGQLNHSTLIAEKHRKLASGPIAAHSVRMSRMAWLIRKSAALVAVYSIALQAALWGFAPAGHFGFDPFAIICTADRSGAPSLPQHRGDCDACFAACSSSPALV